MDVLFNVLFSDEAIEDYKSAYNWYEDKVVGLGSKFENSLDFTLTELGKHPFGFEQKYRGVRVAYIQRFPFGIHYLVEGNSVFVQSIFH